ncbi:hypothetical protein C0Q70_14436 [Pomacea canaliculata]|uniref:Uncharacterized protein n=1 Tax=Pomacea canaliculata TaxID=400727 RepID=A0A2T7NZZ7_POMCA|nr:hypothetical protein C0Q70_14436 [Pomacea canaliculata]
MKTVVTGRGHDLGVGDICCQDEHNSNNQAKHVHVDTRIGYSNKQLLHSSHGATPFASPSAPGCGRYRRQDTRDRLQAIRHKRQDTRHKRQDTRAETRHKTQETRHKRRHKRQDTREDTRHKRQTQEKNTQDTRDKRKTQDTRDKTQETRDKTQDTRGVKLYANDDHNNWPPPRRWTC